MTKSRHFVLVFDSTHLAIKVERNLKGSCDVEMIPTPRRITASCGLSLKVSPEDLPKAVAAVNNLEADRNLVRIYDMGTESFSIPAEIEWRREDDDR